MIDLTRTLQAAVLLLSASSFAAAGTGGIDGPGPWSGPNGAVLTHHLLVKTEAGIELGQGDSAAPWTDTGVPAIDALNQLFDVVGVHRLFIDPPKGHRDPALFASLGMDRIYYFVFRSPQIDVASIASQYEALDVVEKSWADGVVRTCNTPNDTKWSSQWNLTPQDVNCEPGWDDITDATVLIAVVDTGGDLAHQDLDGNLWVNPGEIPGNGQDDDANGYVDDVNGWDFYNGDAVPADDNGHGTHVSGILGAEGNNNRDIAGICWKAVIQEVKVLHKDGSGTWTSMAQGITYAAENGASIANYSFGGTGGDPAADAAVQYAAGVDVVQVAAAGNNASSTEFYPAAYDPVIAVMASDWAENRAAWSNYGDWCDVCAPGDGITSLWLSNQTSALTGTSQASPHVAAIAALVRTMNPQYDRIDTELIVEHSAKDLGAAGKDPTFQWGLVDLDEALIKARSMSLSTQVATLGSSVDVVIDCPDDPNDYYFLLPSISGRVPGVDLIAFFADDYKTLPLNADFVTMASLAMPNLGVFDQFVGVLDGAGTATARFNIPRGSLFRNEDVSFACMVVAASDLSKSKRVTSSIVLKVR